MKVKFITLIGVLIFGQSNISHAQNYIGSAELNANVVFNTNTKVIRATESITLKPGFTATPSTGQSLIISIGLAPGVEDPYLNWTTSKTFDQNGVAIAATKNFFDAAGNPLQSQSCNIETNNVFASQTIDDAYGNASLSTLPAPIFTSGFSYKYDFVSYVENASGETEPYSSINFDKSGKHNSPDPIANTEMGTLGWYYSANNTVEPYVDQTSYPFAIDKYYKEATGESFRSSAPGEAMTQGSGHEVMQRTLPAFSDLAGHYSTVYSNVFPNLPARTFDQKISKSVSKDVNGKVSIAYTDANGKLLAGCLVGNEYAPTSNSYTIKKNYHSIRLFGSGNQYHLHANGYIRVFKNTTLVYEGYHAGFYEGLAKYNGYYIQSDNEFTVSYEDTYQTGSPLEVVHSVAEDYKGNEIYIPDGSSINVTNTCATAQLRITNLTDYYTTSPIYTAASNLAGSLIAGKFYKIEFVDYPIATSTSASEVFSVTITVNAKLGNWSYNYYNEVGQIVSSISPNGVNALKANPPTAYHLVDKTTSTYDGKGRLSSVREPDAGMSRFLYSKDGKIRFSSNSVQGEGFSFTNYDHLGRPIQSGEVLSVEEQTDYVFGSQSMLNDLELAHLEFVEVGQGGGPLSREFPAERLRSITTTSYDFPDTDECARIQEYTFGNVSYNKNENSKTWYSYDELGRVKWVIRRIKLTDNTFKEFTIDYTYDYFGNVTEVAYQKDVMVEAFYHRYTYDKISRLKKVETKTGSTSWQEEAEYYYYLHGPLKRVELANNLQGIDYVYNINGMLKSMNHPETSKDPGKDGSNGFSQDVFGMTLEYYNGDYTRTGTNIASINTQRTDYSGNIQGQTWRVAEPTISGGTLGTAKMQVFDYDNKYQLTGSQMAVPSFANKNFSNASNAFSERGLSYDANGNIKTLQRFDGSGNLVDNFNYTYQANTNKLLSVTGEVDNVMGATYANYQYDGVGNMRVQEVAHNSQANHYVQYDVSGKVIGVYASATYGSSGWVYDPQDLKESYKYDDSGYRILKKNHLSNHEAWYINDASGNLMAIYEKQGIAALTQTELPVYGGSRIGIYKKQGGTSTYELKDQLGTVKAIINRGKRSNGLADVVYSADYYPFGQIAQGDGIASRFGYQGEYAEKDGETEWHAFDLRMYDSRIGRWLRPDPYREFTSPYTGMGNNPAKLFDPTGGCTDPECLRLIKAFNPTSPAYWRVTAGIGAGYRSRLISAGGTKLDAGADWAHIMFSVGSKGFGIQSTLGSASAIGERNVYVLGGEVYGIRQSFQLNWSGSSSLNTNFGGLSGNGPILPSHILLPGKLSTINFIEDSPRNLIDVLLFELGWESNVLDYYIDSSIQYFKSKIDSAMNPFSEISEE